MNGLLEVLKVPYSNVIITMTDAIRLLYVDREVIGLIVLLCSRPKSATSIRCSFRNLFPIE